MQVAQLIVEGCEPNAKNSFRLPPGARRNNRDKVGGPFNGARLHLLNRNFCRDGRYFLFALSLIWFKKRLDKVFFLRSG